MLTIATIAPQQGEWYYKQENYYSLGAALANSEWWGRGAEAWGLSGRIADDEAYKNLLNGLSPDGTQPLREKPRPRKAGEKQPKERAGVDMTFSAPKSVSIACLVGADKRLEEAHQTAVKRTLELVEQRYAQTRSKGERVKTDNLTVALWHHDRNEMFPYWQQEADLYGITHPVSSRSIPALSPEAVEAELISAVKAGIAHCSEREVAFKQETIEKFVSEEIRPFRLTEIERVVKDHPDLLETFDGRFTTQAALHRELRTIRLMQLGQGQVEPIAHLEEIDGCLEGKGFTTGQKEAIALSLTLQYQSGKTDIINLYEPLHLDYALVSTTYSSQGKTAERVLISASAEPTVSQESFYVAISRAKYDLKLYVQDQADLLERATQSKAHENPLELLRQRIKAEIEQTSILSNPQQVAHSSDLEEETETLPSPFPSRSSLSLNGMEESNSFKESHESAHTEQPQSIDGADIGRRASESLNAASRTARPDRGLANHAVTNSGAVELHYEAGQPTIDQSEQKFESSLQSTQRASDKCGEVSHYLRREGRGAQPTARSDEPEVTKARGSVSRPTAEFQQLSENALD